jgi:competence protein ComEC
MVLVTGFVFGLVRFGIAAIPPLALRLPAKKIAAAAALGVGALYLALSGMDVPAERAFVQVAVVLAAVLVDRRAVTLRAVALAGVIVLSLRPEALTEPGFQMSFAATVALVAGFEAWRGRETRLPRMARPVAALLLSSLIAGTATAPFAAAHFNMVTHYGLLANTLAVPVMGLLVMPAAVLAALLAPFGLHGIGLRLMEPGIDWILFVARSVAALPGAVSHVPSPQPAVMPLIALGALWLVLWQGRPRIGGLAPVAAAFFLWTQVERPTVLISPSGSLVGVLTPEGRALSKPRGDSFAAETWLENDGAPAPQEDAHARPGFSGVPGALTFPLGEASAIHLTGRGAAARMAEVCASHALVVLAAKAAGGGPCAVIDETSLARTGAVAIYAEEGATRAVTARDRAGHRPWNTR